jgi:hypothetical protein
MKSWRNNNEINGLFGKDENIYSSITLKDCGLDPEWNFMQAPECECGCGEKCSICLKNDDEALSFCKTMVYENNECNKCTVFAITKENMLLGAIKQDDDIYCFKSKDPIKYMSDIGEIFDELELHCYGLIVWNGEGLYRIVEE